MTFLSLVMHKGSSHQITKLHNVVLKSHLGVWINHLHCGQAAPAPRGQPDHHDRWQSQLLQVQDQSCKTAKRTNSRFLDLIEATNMTEMVDQPARTLIVPTNQAFENLKEEVGCILQDYSCGSGGRGELFCFEPSTTLLSGSSSPGGGL